LNSTASRIAASWACSGACSSGLKSWPGRPARAAARRAAAVLVGPARIRTGSVWLGGGRHGGAPGAVGGGVTHGTAVVCSRGGGLLGMEDDHRHVGLLLVGQRTLAAQPAMRAAELAMIGGAHDSRGGPEVERGDRVEQALQGAVVVPDVVEIKVVVLVPHGGGV